MLTFLLQADTSEAINQAAAAVATQEKVSLSMIDMAVKGGWLMIPLIILSILADQLIFRKVLMEFGVPLSGARLGMLLIPLMLQTRAYQDPVSGFYSLMQVLTAHAECAATASISITSRHLMSRGFMSLRTLRMSRWISSKTTLWLSLT